VGEEHQRHFGDQADARQVFTRVKIDVLVQGLVDRHGAARHQQRIAIGGAAHHKFAANVAACTRLVLDDDRLPQTLAELLGQRAGEDVGGLAGRKRHDQLDGFFGVFARIYGNGGRCSQ